MVNIAINQEKYIIKDGKKVYDFPKLSDIQSYYKKELNKFNRKLLSINKKYKYPIEISISLKRKIKEAKLNLRKISHDETE